MIRALTFALLGSVCVAGCDNSLTISDNAQLVQADGAKWGLISKNGHFLVLPQVVSLSCVGEWAYGEHDGSGFFMLDLDSNELIDRLTETELKERLAQTGIDYAEPHDVKSIRRYLSGCG